MWEPFEFFIGSWQGTGSGQPGVSKVERTYEFMLNGKFLHVRNKSIYAPQEQNPQGEIHEDLGFISYDKNRQTFVMRQFHVEGFVNQYAIETLAPDEQTIVFVTESIENIPVGWRAKETYTRLNADEFMEVFELAAPGKDFEVYSTSLHRRVT